MASYNIELNSKPVYGSNEYILLLRITVNRKHARLKLDYALPKKQFNPRPKHNLYVRSSHSKHKIINNYIDEQIQKAKNVARELEKEGKLVTAKAIKQRMIQPQSSSFLEFVQAEVDNMKRNNKIGSHKRYKVLISKIRACFGNEDISFQEIDHSFLDKFHSYLVSIKNNPNTIHANFRMLRAIIFKAIDLGLMKQGENPFYSFKLKSGKVNRVRLDQDEIKKIEELELNPNSLIWHVKNIFLFSFYCAGIRASDLIQLKWDNIDNGRLVYRMHKTNKVHSLKLHEKSLSILEFYGPQKPDSYIFPFFRDNIDYSDPVFLHNQISAKTALINKYLKQLAQKSGISKNISTHTARHSFADIARKKTDNLYNLSKTLGHSSLKITEAYLASFDEDVIDETLDDVFN